MDSDDDRSLEQPNRIGTDPPHDFDRPHLHGLRITKTADGVILSGTVESTDPRDVLRQVEELLSQLPGEAVEDSGSDRVQESRSDSLPKDSDRGSADTACQQQDVLNWEDLIPVAPPRPSGQIQVRLKKARKDGPASADDPWAK